MKRMAWWILGIAALGMVVVGDDLEAQRLEIGARGGINATTIAWSTSPLGDGPDTLERRRRFSGGMLVAFNATERLKLRLEVLHSGKGFREIQDDGDITALDLDYLEIPLLAGLNDVLPAVS